MTAPCASLPMYERPETAGAQHRLWVAIRDELRGRTGDAGALPDDLTRAADLPEDLVRHWLSPGLAFSQTCGMPYRTRLAPHVTLVGTPDFGLPGCPPGHYNSVLVIRADDDRDAPDHWPSMRLAVNDPGSHSGWAAPETHLNGLGLSFTRVVLTGAHRRSAEAVAEGRADIAAIDAQTWRAIARWDGVAGALREAGRTDPTPGLPYITAGRRDAAVMFAAIRRAVDLLGDTDRATLDLRGLAAIGRTDYEAIPSPPFPGATAARIA